MPRLPRFGTFSVVAFDPDRQEWGVAVHSKFISVGAVVPWAQANVGAVATQALANLRYGPEGLALLAKGVGASEVVEKLTSSDPKREHRQLGVVDRHGSAAAFTGKECMNFAGHRVGQGFAVQGNILLAEAVVEAMARAFETTPGDLPERLLATLAAGQREGGDRRGMQSAAMLIVKEKGGYDEGSDRWVDIRVDDHPSPIEELKRIFKLYDLTLLTREDPSTLVPITPDVARSVQQQLQVIGFYSGRFTSEWDAPTRAAFEKFLGESNFEGKARDDGRMWPSVLEHLSERSQAESRRRTTTQPVLTGALTKGPGAAPAGEEPSAKKKQDHPPHG
ncbi:MAG: DUF1028 domain-containing protein [Thermoplasmata archaeon]|nr:DUF1028 domain-containing protein [Thermoplasmata archaeon]